MDSCFTEGEADASDAPCFGDYFTGSDRQICGSLSKDEKNLSIFSWRAEGDKGTGVIYQMEKEDGDSQKDIIC